MRTGLALVAMACAGWLTSATRAQDAFPGADDEGAEAPVVIVTAHTPPRTQLETALARKGTLLVKRAVEITVVPGEAGSSVRLLAVQVTDQAAGQTHRGLILAVRRPGDRLAGECIAYVDLEEINALAAALDAIGRQEPTDALPLLEASYRTRGDLELINFDERGGRMIAVRATQVLSPTGQLVTATARCRPAALADLRRHALAARDLLQANR